MTKHVNAATAADRLRVSASTISRWARDGRLTPLYKVPGLRGSFVFDEAEVERVARERAAEMDAKRPAVSA